MQIEINDDFQYALDAMELTNSHLFITGRAGSGKSTLLRHFRANTKKNVVVLAPTGIAALNVQGQTIHSFFGFPAKPITKADIKPRRFKKLFKKIDAIIIDEISMVRADMLDNMDYFLRLNAKIPSEPFGGIQMIFFGDLFQLPPVVTQDDRLLLEQLYYSSPYFFGSHIFEKEKFQRKYEMIELSQVYRQKNRGFLKLLDNIRLNQFDYDDLETLNERVIPEYLADKGYVTLSTRNSIVNQINSQRLTRLNEVEFTYVAKITGDFSTRVHPTDMALKLKKGAQVMFIKNDPQGRYVNGTIGVVSHLSNEAVQVKVEQTDGSYKTIHVVPDEWELIKYKLDANNEIKSDVKGSFKQYPLKLAWAMTIHKSQGKTFDKVIIDMGRGAFEHGQTYVALSRCRTLDGIILKKPITPRDIRTDERVVEFYEGSR